MEKNDAESEPDGQEVRNLPLVAGRTQYPVLEQEALQGRVRRQRRLHVDQGLQALFVILPSLGRVGKAAVIVIGGREQCFV